MTTGKTPGYILTFRCLNCGNHEVFACYPSEDVLPEDEVRARIYQACCTYCGWRGDACGASAIHISHTLAPKAKKAGQGN